MFHGKYVCVCVCACIVHCSGPNAPLNGSMCSDLDQLIPTKETGIDSPELCSDYLLHANTEMHQYETLSSAVQAWTPHTHRQIHVQTLYNTQADTSRSL